MYIKILLVNANVHINHLLEEWSSCLATNPDFLDSRSLSLSHELADLARQPGWQASGICCVAPTCLALTCLSPCLAYHLGGDLNSDVLHHLLCQLRHLPSPKGSFLEYPEPFLCSVSLLYDSSRLFIIYLYVYSHCFFFLYLDWG